jgi:Acetyltransferase (GNAT) domain
MDYRLVRYQPEFIDQIALLQTGLWSPDLATNVAYFEWKYQQNPYVSEPLIYLAVENERVVAMRGFYGSQWAIGESGQTLTLPCAGDTIIAPDHRRHGLLRQMLQFERSDVLSRSKRKTHKRKSHKTWASYARNSSPKFWRWQNHGLSNATS